jgi:hypothetical protein
VLTAWLLPVGVIFGPIVSSSASFAFRDAAHYYPPLWQTVREQWRHGLPLWNPDEERGRPLLADPTAAVLYPGQLIFALPLAFSTAFEWQIVGHVLLACLTSFVAARRLRLGHAAAVLASVSYALGGSIVFQYCNPPYLISAAWLPLGASSVLRIVQGGGGGAVVELSVVLALMVLGGDPQTAYLLGVASLGAATLASRTRAATFRAAFRLLVAAILAVGLSAAVLVPAWQWGRTGERWGQRRAVQAGHAERESDERSDTRALEDYSRARYRFSIGPWRWIELLWPNAGGRPFPDNQRWIRALPAEGSFWSPSLYMGIVPLWLGLSAFRLRGGAPAERWLSWCLLLGALGSLGRFGIGWLISDMAAAVGRPAGTWSDEVGGCYWLLSWLLPGFDLFRYPAKLWTWSALALSLLASIRCDRCSRAGCAPCEPRWLMGYVGLTLSLLVFMACCGKWVDDRLAACPPDSLFGPLDGAAARRAMRLSLIQGGLVVLPLLWLSVRHRNGPPQIADGSGTTDRRGAAAWCLVALTVLDLTLADAWMAPRVDASTLGLQPEFATQAADRSEGQGPLILRVGPRSWYPSQWAVQNQSDPLAACMAWDRLTARPKYPLQAGCASLRSSTSCSSRDHLALLELLEQLSARNRAAYVELLRQLGVDVLCGPESIEIAGVESRRLAGAPEARVWQLGSPLPRAWIVQQAVVLSSIEPTDADSLRRRTQQALLPEGKPRDLRRQVVLEVTGLLEPATRAAGYSRDSSQDSCQLVEAGASRLTISARLSQAGWLVVNDAYAAGWRARLRARDGVRPLPVLRANRVMRAVALPAGQHRVEFEYRPASVRWGLAISGLSLVLLLLSPQVRRGLSALCVSAGKKSRRGAEGAEGGRP